MMIGDGVAVHRPAKGAGLIPIQEALHLWFGGSETFTDSSGSGREVSIELIDTDKIDWDAGSAVSWGFAGSVFGSEERGLSFASHLDLGKSFVVSSRGITASEFEPLVISIPAVGGSAAFGSSADGKTLGSEIPSTREIAEWLEVGSAEVELEITGGMHTGVPTAEINVPKGAIEMGFCIADAEANSVRDYALTIPRPRFVDGLPRVTVGGALGSSVSQLLWWQRHRFFHFVARTDLATATRLTDRIQKGVM